MGIKKPQKMLPMCFIANAVLSVLDCVEMYFLKVEAAATGGFALRLTLHISFYR